MAAVISCKSSLVLSKAPSGILEGNGGEVASGNPLERVVLPENGLSETDLDEDAKLVEGQRRSCH